MNSKNEIESSTYRDYLLDYGIDWCTSPRSTTDRAHIREKEIKIELADGTTEVEYEYEIWDWGVNGNNPYYLGKSFDNEEDAKLYLFELREDYIAKRNSNAPQFFNTYDEAVIELAAILNRREAVLRRYLSISAIAERKAVEHKSHGLKTA